MLMRRQSLTKTSYRFAAMASPCSVTVEGLTQKETNRLGQLAETEARRIETKYSRYREDSVLSAINRSNGAFVEIDNETRALVDYAVQCHALSNGLFDITSGVLRRVWKFDGSDNVPACDAVAAILPSIGLDKVEFDDRGIRLQPGMEIDFGGLGKEYAVDRVLLILAAETNAPLLVNFGGDLRVSSPRASGKPWRIAIEDTDGGDAQSLIEIGEGALTTSGDAKRFLLKDDVRYSHILNPKTGWPVVNPPRSVTVAAATCMEAGILSTLAMAHGAVAESFLENERCLAWVTR
jgi:FAD:protein FMN transferase